MGAEPSHRSSESVRDDPDQALAAVVAMRRTADRLEEEAVGRAIELGWSWAQIAQALGVSRQAAHKKHAKRIAAGGGRPGAT